MSLCQATLISGGTDQFTAAGCPVPQPEWLIESKRAGTDGLEQGDVHDRVCGLTDLAQPERLPVSETTGAKLP